MHRVILMATDRYIYRTDCFYIQMNRVNLTDLLPATVHGILDTKTSKTFLEGAAMFLRRVYCDVMSRDTNFFTYLISTC